ncbi:MAG TPA: cell division protein FtsH, partial [Bacillales bacterium]|nr:cell division protein FtsH [Bacillales bacterium]
SYERCKKILTENWEKIELMVKTLLDVETLEAEEIKSLWHEGKLPEASEKKKIEANQSSDAKKEEEPDNKDLKVNIHSKKKDDEEDEKE